MVEETDYTINRLQLIITYPAMFVPSLSDESIRSALIEVVVGYFEGEIDFQILLSVTESLALFRGIRKRTPLNYVLSNLLIEINELSHYEKNLEGAKETINDVLAKTIDTLIIKNTSDSFGKTFEIVL